MPTNRTRKKRSIAPAIHPIRLKKMRDEPTKKCWESFDEISRKEWDQNKKDVLLYWKQKFPGTRPESWWRFDAPEMRKRLGGIGDPDFMFLGVKPSFSFGLPDTYLSQFEVDYYNGRAVDIHGVLIPCQWQEGDFKGLAINPDDPPFFESQAAYLKRHKLLTQAEKDRLKPVDFRPERIKIDED